MIVRKKVGSAWIGILLLLVFIISLGLAIVTDSISNIALSKKSAQIVVAQALCDAGIEKTIWELNNNGSYTGEEGYALPTGEIDIDISGDLENKEVLVTAYVPDKENPKTKRTTRAKIASEPSETNVAFNYAVQVGGLGLTMSNQAVLNGNIYSAGTVGCAQNAQINGDAFVSKDSENIYGDISGCKIGGNAEAYNLLSSTIAGWGKYVGSNNNSSATGGFTNITEADLDNDLPYTNLPISDLTLEGWKSWAQAGGSYYGNYQLNTGQSASIGPRIIEGNLTINSGATLTLTGVVWVRGNIILNTGSTVNLAPSFGPNSGMLLADTPADRSASGYIRVYSNVQILGSGNPASYILMLSTNTKSTTSDPAIFAGNNSTSVVYYTTTGMIEVNNNARLKAVSGGGLHLSNGAQLDYDTGLASTNFSGGPGGSWKLKEWQVVH